MQVGIIDIEISVRRALIGPHLVSVERDGGTCLKGNDFVARMVVGELTRANFRSSSVQQNGTNIVIRTILWRRSSIAGQFTGRRVTSLNTNVERAKRNKIIAMITAVVRKEWLRCCGHPSSIVVDPPHLASLEVGSPELHFLDGGMGEVEAHYIYSSMNELLQNWKLLRSRADGRHDLGERSVAVVGTHSLAFVIAIEPNRGLEGWAGPCRDGREGCGRNGPATSGS